MLGIDALCHASMKARSRPMSKAFDLPMFDGIIVNVIEVEFEFLLIFRRVFPIPWLPHPGSTFAARCHLTPLPFFT